MAKIGSPLFIVREECQRDLMAVLDKIAEIGFDGVEFVGLFGHTPASIRKKLDSLGLAAVGDHVPFDEFVNNTDRVIDGRIELGCKYITVGAPGADGLPGGSGYSRTVATYERLGEMVNSAGLKLLFHNHADEVRSVVNGKAVLEHLLDDVRSDLLFFEPDLGWIGIGGGDPVHYLTKYPNRCPVVHFKDYIPDGDGCQFRPTGYGVMNNAELYAMTLSFDPRPEWYVLDHDLAYERDSFFDLAISLDYMRNLITVTR